MYFEHNAYCVKKTYTLSYSSMETWKTHYWLCRVRVTTTTSVAPKKRKTLLCSKQKNKWMSILVYLMGIGNNILIPPRLLKVLHWDFHNICELFWDVKMETYIFGKIPKINSRKTASQFTPKTTKHFKKYLRRDTN